MSAQPEILSEFLPTEPWWCLNMDILGTARTTASGNKHILVIVDKLMCYCLLEAIPNQEAEMVMGVFVKAMLHMGFLRHIFTDHGSQFTSQLAAGLAKTFGVTRVYTSKFNPQSDGQTENLN